MAYRNKETMKNLKDIILEKLVINKNLKIKTINVVDKIFDAFGFKTDKEESEDDDFTRAIKKWVDDNNIEDVDFYTDNIEDLEDLCMPKKIKKMYSSKNKVVDDALRNTEELANDNVDFILEGNKKILVFMSKYGYNLYALSK